MVMSNSKFSYWWQYALQSNTNGSNIVIPMVKGKLLPVSSKLEHWSNIHIVKM